MIEKSGTSKAPGARPGGVGSAERSLRLSEAREAILNGAPERALEICQAEMKPAESDKRWLLLHAEVLVALNRGAEALEDLITLLKQNQKEAEAFFRVGQILLKGDEPIHAERYISHAVRLAGGKSSYKKVLKQAQERALTEGSQLGGAGSSLPAADDDLDADPEIFAAKERVRAGLSALISFERESGLFDSKLKGALGATKRMFPRWSDLKQSKQLRRATILVALGVLVVLGGLVATGLALRRCESQQSLVTASEEVERGIVRGGASLRAAALEQAQRLYDRDDNDAAVAHRLAWLLATRYAYDSADPELLAEANELLAKHADADEPLAVLAAALAAVAAGHAPGASAEKQAFEDPQYESMRQEVLAADARQRGNAAEALRLVVAALSSRPKSVDLHVLAAETTLESGQLKKAAEWIKKAKAFVRGEPALAVAEASLLMQRGEPPAAISGALGPAVSEEVPNRHRFRALALAVSLRAELGEVGAVPPFKDIEAAIGKDETRALAAAEALLGEGWPDFAERALQVAKVDPPPGIQLALEVASGRIADAAKLVGSAGLTVTPLLRALAVQAAAAGQIDLVDSCLARLEVLDVDACSLVATRSRVALRRGHPVTKEERKQLKECPVTGPVLLWRVEQAVSEDGKGLKKIDRRELRSARGLGLEPLAVLGLYDLFHNQATRTDEAGRMLLARRATSREGLALRLRAAIAMGDYPRAIKLYADAPDELKEAPLVVGYVALARFDRGESKSLIDFLDKLEIEASKRGLGVLTAARAMATLSKRTARKVIDDLKRSDPSPYNKEARARAYLALGKEDAAALALKATGGAIERRLEHQLLQAEVAFAKSDTRKYRDLLEAVEDTASSDLANGPLAAEAKLRRVAVIEDHNTRREQLEGVGEMLDAWGRIDGKSPRMRSLERLAKRVSRRPLEFPQ